MTEDIREKLIAADFKLRATSDEIVHFSRSLVATLRDAGCEQSAKELEHLLFEHEAAIGDASNLLRDNAKDIVRLVKGGKP